MKCDILLIQPVSVSFSPTETSKTVLLDIYYNLSYAKHIYECSPPMVFLYYDQQEWKKELELLWRTLKTESGDICSSCPDDTESPEAYVAWCKVQAVYGELSPSTTLEDLMKPNEVTKHLGKPIDIAEEEVV